MKKALMITAIVLASPAPLPQGPSHSNARRTASTRTSTIQAGAATQVERTRGTSANGGGWAPAASLPAAAQAAQRQSRKHQPGPFKAWPEPAHRRGRGRAAIPIAFNPTSFAAARPRCTDGFCSKDDVASTPGRGRFHRDRFQSGQMGLARCGGQIFPRSA